MNFNGFPIKESYESEIKQVINHIFDCHNLMILDGEPIKNNENKIRNRLIKRYLTNQKVKNKLGITGFRFFPEVAVIDENDDETGYTDIHVILSQDFDNDDAVFIFECKRLDGKGDLGKDNLNGKYVNNGVMRFITEQYPTYFSINGMIGFCVESFDIHQNTEKINQHLGKWCPTETTQYLQKESFIDGFDYTYVSSHIRDKDKNSFKLYHTMLNVTSLIEKQ